MSFNVRYSSGDDGANSWDNRKKAVPAMFADQQPTVLGVQEARLDQKTYMDENCAGYKSVGVGRTDGQNAGEFMAIYYLADAVKLEKWGTFWLSDTPDVPSVGWDASTARPRGPCSPTTSRAASSSTSTPTSTMWGRWRPRSRWS